MATLRLILLCTLVLFISACEEKSAEHQQTGAGDAAAPSTEMSEADTDKMKQQAEKAAEEMAQTAKVLLDETTQYINDNKFELAEKSLAKLDEMKPELPESYHGKIDSAHKALQAAKATAEVKSIGQ